jgi:hypothetical protein
MSLICASPLGASRLACARNRWDHAARLVSTRWQMFLAAEPEARAFASYVAALDAEETAAAGMSSLVSSPGTQPESAMEFPRLPRAHITHTRRLPFVAIEPLAALIVAPRLKPARGSSDTIADRTLTSSPRRSPHTYTSQISAPTTEGSIIMVTRYFAWLAIGLAAAFLVVVSASFTSLAAIAALALGFGIGTLIVSAAIAYRYRDHIPTVVTAVVTAVVSAWTIVASQVFSHPTVQNLALAGALAIAGLAVVGLTANELASERVTHSLEVSDERRESQLAAAA